jgi:23S rRNA (adenine-N6)-dimethyltransferase
MALGQHFFRCEHLVRTLVAESGIHAADTVVEIGAGEGIITQALAEIAGRVIAIEKDPALARQLQRRFQCMPNVCIIAGDFLTQPAPPANYVIFANIPFNCTAQIMRWIVYGDNPPQAAHLVMQREAAGKFAGAPVETKFSAQTKPWFSVDLARQLRRTDFSPIPNVEIALLRIKRREPPLFPRNEAASYRQFVAFGFRRGRANLRLTFKPVFTYPQWTRLADQLHFARDALPSELTMEQWLGLYSGFRRHASPERQALIEPFTDTGR